MHKAEETRLLTQPLLMKQIAALVCFGSLLVVRAYADAPAWGSDTFLPSPSYPVGWRGDGNGRYPAAQPPIQWGKQTQAVLELRGQGKAPGANETGNPLCDGVIRDWLTLGPVTKGKLDGQESNFKPDEGQKLDENTWQRFTNDTAVVNFRAIYPTEDPAPNPSNVVAYAHTYLYSKAGKPVFLNSIFSENMKAWLNGLELKFMITSGIDHGRVQLNLQPGWNRLLLRVSPRKDMFWSRNMRQWYLTASVFGADTNTATQNIAWSTPMPDRGPGVSSPIAVGDKLFVLAEPFDLVCLNQQDGAVKWVRASTFLDAATPAERSNNPALFQELDATNAIISAMLEAYRTSPQDYAMDEKARPWFDAKSKLELEINKKMLPVDKDKYHTQSRSEGGWSAPTPVSDGQFVYAIFGSGVVACFDLQGNRIWTTTINVSVAEHGYCNSPRIVDGKLVLMSPNAQYRGAVALNCRNGAVIPLGALFTPNEQNHIPDFRATPIAVSCGDEKLLVQSAGIITRLRDGKVLAQDFAPKQHNIGDAPSPVKILLLSLRWLPLTFF